MKLSQFSALDNKTLYNASHSKPLGSEYYYFWNWKSIAIVIGEITIAMKIILLFKFKISLDF